MIGYLVGTLISKDSKTITVLAGQVGYRVSVAAPVHLQLAANQEVKLFISTVVREDDIHLYGFLTQEEQRVFEVVTSVSGVGPSIAMRLLGALPPDRLVAALQKSDVATIEAIPGIGKKTAARLIVELAEALDVANMQSGSGLHEQVKDALQNLGYSQKEAQRMTAGLPAEGDVADMLRAALRNRSS